MRRACELQGSDRRFCTVTLTNRSLVSWNCDIRLHDAATLEPIKLYERPITKNCTLFVPGPSSTLGSSVLPSVANGIKSLLSSLHRLFFPRTAGSDHSLLGGCSLHSFAVITTRFKYQQTLEEQPFIRRLAYTLRYERKNNCRGPTTLI